MKILVVSSREKIFTLNPNEHIVHLAFMPSKKDIFGLIETCLKVEVIQIPKSYMGMVSNSIQMFLETQTIKLLEGDFWGHRKDINEYYAIPSSVIEKIKEMKLEGKSAEDIETSVSRERKLNLGIIAYILTKETPA